MLLTYTVKLIIALTIFVFTILQLYRNFLYNYTYMKYISYNIGRQNLCILTSALLFSSSTLCLFFSTTDFPFLCFYISAVMIMFFSQEAIDSLLRDLYFQYLFGSDSQDDEKIWVTHKVASYFAFPWLNITYE